MKMNVKEIVNNNNLDLDIRKIIGRIRQNSKTMLAADDTKNTDASNNDSDNTDSNEDSDDDTELPITPATKAVCDAWSNYGDQSYVIENLVKQVEQLKTAGDTENMNSAIAGLSEAVKDHKTMHKTALVELENYLKPFKK
jgi:hypothetical protein